MLFRFDRYELDEERYELRTQPVDGGGAASAIELQPKVMEVLLHLVRHADRTLTKDELLDAVWGDVAITEASLTRCISLARRALGEHEGEPRILQTVRGRGYRIGVAVERIEASAAGARPAERAPPPSEPRAVPTAPRSRRGLWIAAAALAGVLLLAWLARPFESALLAPQPEPAAAIRPGAVAVLAFGDLREETSRSLAADALALEVIDHLSRWPELEVTSHRSSFRFPPDEAIDPLAVGEHLGVATLVTGALRPAGNGQLRVQVELVDARTGFQRWAKSFALGSAALPASQGEIAREVVAALGVGVDAIHPFKRRAPRADARRLLLEGRQALVDVSRNRLLEAVQTYERALELDPELIRGYVALSEAYHVLWERDGEFRSGGENWLPAAEAVVLEALERAPEDPEALTMYGTVRTSQKDWAGAEAALRLALEHGGGAFASHRLAVLLLIRGRIGEARPHVERALRLDPLSQDIVRGAGRFHLYAGELPLAVATLERALELDPSDLWVPRLLANAYEMLGDHDAAREAMLRNFPGFIRPFARIQGRLFGTGRSVRALLALDILRSGKRCRHDAHGTALMWAYLGERARALECLRQASGHHLWYVVSEPVFRPYRDDPAFRAALEAAGFAPDGGWAAGS